MKTIRHIVAVIVVVLLASSAMLPGLTGPSAGARDMGAHALVQGAQAGLQAYAGASDAYAEQAMLSSPVAFWALLIAAFVVLLEWLVSLHRRGH